MANEQTERVVRVEQSDPQTGWAVAVIVLVLILIAGGVAWAYYHRAAPAKTPDNSTNINVTLPSGTNNTGTDSGAQQ